MPQIWVSQAQRVSLIVVQIAFLYVISVAGNWITLKYHLPVPGSILGFALLFLLLQLKVVRLSWFEQGANWLLANLLLFFIPPAVGIVQYGAMLELEGFRVLFVIVVSTTVVMLLTGTMADRIADLTSQKPSLARRKMQ
ncbi:MAG: hypothetical protein A2201_00010 [Alicyclobacillus sp. RIFOXYA1_FULL_53_8]|nr:MAG: hypothetical protein A2201_00010 [Alicyclobacillus sp. RIFOXYA1_FULL_53_8]